MNEFHDFILKRLHPKRAVKDLGANHDAQLDEEDEEAEKLDKVVW